MASILTNTSAMVALQTLKSTNKNMAAVQGQISTGLKVASAKDNASTWAIAQTMRSDVGGFKSIKSGLAVAEATVNVARNAAESIANLMNKIKEKVVEAQSESVDRGKIQTDIEAMRDQIISIVGTAQFNGVNLLDATNGSDSMRVLSSLDRSSDQSVTAGSFSVAKNDLRVNGLVRVATDDLSGYMAWSSDPASTAPEDALNTVAGGGGEADLILGNVTGGNVFRVSVGDTTRSFTVRDNETAQELGTRIAGAFSSGDVSAIWDETDSVVRFTNNGSEALDLGRAAFSAADDGNGNPLPAGGLAALATLDVTVDEQAALDAVEGLVQSALNAATAFGSAQQRIEIQSEFLGKLVDSMNTGVGSMVDADMEEASARLQALQVQQQLGIQSLSIANQNPQNILALFR
jgi:flagellin